MTTVSIVLPALLAGLLVVLTHVPLGIEVLRRGIVFIDLAVAQTAAFGMVLAVWLDSLFHDETHTHSETGYVMVAAYIAAVICASGLYFLRRAPARIQEAIIGCVFVLAASFSVLLLSSNPQGGEHLKELLVGQILWVSTNDLYLAAVFSSLVIIGLLVLKNRGYGFAFYPVFAIAITLATQLVGVYLVFATLIIPALVAYRSRHPLILAYITGVGGYVIGLSLSVLLDSPSGAVIVLSLAMFGGVVCLADRLLQLIRKPVGNHSDAMLDTDNGLNS